MPLCFVVARVDLSSSGYGLPTQAHGQVYIDNCTVDSSNLALKGLVGNEQCCSLIAANAAYVLCGDLNMLMDGKKLPTQLRKVQSWNSNTARIMRLVLLSIDTHYTEVQLQHHKLLAMQVIPALKNIFMTHLAVACQCGVHQEAGSAPRRSSPLILNQLH